MVAYRQSRHCRARLQGPMIAKDTGRGERIRTSGPCLPKTVLYQAELLPDRSGAGGPARGQGGPLDSRVANFKHQSARPAELQILQQSGATKAEMPRLDENQMIDQVDPQHGKEGGGVAGAGDVGAARPRYGGRMVVRHQHEADAAAEDRKSTRLNSSH